MVRSALCPSVMVDTDGTLYVVYPYAFITKGLSLFLGKSSVNLQTGTISSGAHSFFPYEEIYKTDTEPAFSIIKFPHVPNQAGYPNQLYLFKQTFHHNFAPCLLQELPQEKNTTTSNVNASNSNTNSNPNDYLCLALFIPPGRWMNAAQDTEGVFLQFFKKSNLMPDSSKMRLYNPGAYGQNYRTDMLRPRRYSEDYLFAPNMGEFFGWKYGDKVGLSFSTLNSYELYYKSEDEQEAVRETTGVSVVYQYNENYIERKNFSTVIKRDGDNVLKNMNRGYQRFIKEGNYIYSIVSEEGYNFALLRTNINSLSKTEVVCRVWYPLYLEWHSQGSSPAPYNHDFCIIKADDGTLIGGCLEFMGQASYSKLQYTDKWENSSDYTFCDPNNAMLMFLSFKLPSKLGTNIESTNIGPQNIIYDSGIGFQTKDAVNVSDTTASDTRRLYLNTHKICTYKSLKTGADYLIYCYCYPGKTKQLFLGYAPYYIDKKDNYNVVLLTKTEYRDKEGNSFGNFKDCSRIISMDCKNGHLWITWMNSDNQFYYSFHIKAEDLIGD